MKSVLKSIPVLLLLAVAAFAQGFNVKAKGIQTFTFEDKTGRNQATFFSTTPLEDVNGLTSEISGKVTFNVDDFANTLKGEVSIVTGSLKTGIEMRDHHLASDRWLDAETYPAITFKIKGVKNVKKLSHNKIEADIVGDFSLHGVTKEVIAPTTITYLDESEATKERASGDLLGVNGKFNIKLSEYNVSNKLLGQKVSDDIAITINIVGSNAAI
jgi:polyisoprenoid-binding protein YceI